MKKDLFRDKKNIALLVGACVLCVAVFFGRFLTLHTQRRLLVSLSDAFSIPGVLIIFFGLFVFALKKRLMEGFFYMIYNIKRMFTKDDEGGYKSFAQFTESRSHQEVGFDHRVLLAPPARRRLLRAPRRPRLTAALLGAAGGTQFHKLTIRRTERRIFLCAGSSIRSALFSRQHKKSADLLNFQPIYFPPL